MVPNEPLRSDLFFSAFAHSAIGIALVGLDGKWLKANNALCRTVGYSVEQLRDLTFQQITHPDDLDADLAQMRQLLCGEIESYQMEKRYFRKDGSVCWIHLTGSMARDEYGMPDFFIAQIVDINQRKQVEADQKAFFQYSPDLLAVADSSGYLQQVSDAWTKLLGWTPSELTSRPFLDFVHPDDRQRTIETAQQQYDLQDTIVFQNRYRHRDGSYRWLEWNTRIIAENRFYAIARDVTAQKAREESLRAAIVRQTESTATFLAGDQVSSLIVHTFESSKDCVKILDCSGRLLAMNRNGQCAMEIDTFSSIQGELWASMWPTENRGTVATAVTAAVNGRPSSFSLPCPTAQGTMKWWDVSVTPIFSTSGSVAGILSVSRDVSSFKEDILASQRSEIIAEGQREALELVIAGASRQQVLEVLARTAEEYSAGKIRTTVMLLDHDQKALHLASAPSFPFSYCDALKDLPLGPNAGSCGLAVARKRPVFVRDVLTEPAWENFRQMAIDNDLRSCWSQPIMSSAGRVFGTFVFYYSEIQEPAWLDLKSVMVLVHTAALVLERDLERQEREATEEALRRSEIQLKRLSDSGILGIIGYHVDGTIKRANDAFLKIVGVSRETFQRYGLSCDGLTPADWKEADRRGWEELAHTGVMQPFEKEYLRMDGSRAAVYLGAAHFEGSSEEGIAYVLDISGLKRAEKALKESEAKFRTITNAMPQMVWSALPDGSYDYFNEQWYNITGVPAGSTEGHGWATNFHPEDQERVRRRWQHCVETGEHYQIEYRLQHRNGEYRWTLGRALPVQDKDGRIIRWMGTCTDIHEQKMAQEALEQADRRKDQFLAMLAHELRNPLAPIAAAADLLAIIGANNERIQHISGVISRQTRHMTDLIDDLLDVSRVTRGIVVLNRQPVRVKQALQEAIEQVMPQSEKRGNVVQTFLGTGEPVVFADKNRLVQIFANVIGNAVKYTPNGGNISLRLQASGSQVTIAVQDDGIGMSSELTRHAFELFTQAERSSDRAQGGLGIGLALVKSLVMQHGGTVTAHSDGVGHGSLFTITLPLPYVDDALPDTAFKNFKNSSTVQRPRLLIVDDNSDVADTLGMFLEACGYHVNVANHAMKAIAHVHEQPVDICLIDIGLPDMKGADLLKSLRSLPHMETATMVAIAGHGLPQDAHATRAAGFDYHFVKPVDTDELLAVIQEKSK